MISDPLEFSIILSPQIRKREKISMYTLREAVQGVDLEGLSAYCSRAEISPNVCR